MIFKFIDILLHFGKMSQQKKITKSIKNRDIFLNKHNYIDFVGGRT